MESEDTNCDEVQEKVGLKRKLTGPPRLLLGKGKDEKKADLQASRKQRRDKNNGTEKHEVEEHQGNDDAGSESQQATCQSPETACTGEEETTQISNLDLQEEPVETVVSNSEQEKVKDQHGRSRQRRCRAKAAIRRVLFPAFACVRRRKQLDNRAAEDAEHNATCDNCQDALTTDTTREVLADSVTERCAKKKNQKRKFHMRICGAVFKRFSVKPKSPSSQKQEKGCVGPDNHILIEITSEKSAADQSDYSAPRPSGDIAVDEQLKGSKEIHEDMAGIHAESCPGKELDQEEECSEKVTLCAEVSSGLNTVFSHNEVEQQERPEQDVIQCHLQNRTNEEDTTIQNTETSELRPALSDSQTEIIPTCVNECNSDINAPEASPDITVNNVVFLEDPDKIVPIENEVKCKPLITIEDVPSSDEEIQEPLENDAPQHNTLSPLFALNGSCHRFKVNRATKDTLHTLDQTENSNSQFSDIVLVQTALTLVHAAINSAMEQLSAELQNNQIDEDHV
ncbi:hypothetical protein AMEX_G1696 [Astyanax mexicanus]|uniref:Uncharacterized protein n=1 Tax=Astyanax mexicanus TaxID=7994 RepID=A0A8T2MMI6_ASTMX|nr:hypothetical protein AMEX_G1696 [Astyanax mexicanus]